MTVSFFQYSLSVSIPLLIMWATYRAALADQKQFALNRVMLLAMYGVSLVLPILNWLNPQDIIAYPAANPDAFLHTPFGLIRWLSMFWLVGAMCVAAFTAIELIRIHTMMRRCEMVKHEGAEIYITDNPRQAPFSIGRCIVMSRRDFDESFTAIMAHEEGHIRLRHSWDMAIAQAVAIICWYNPAAWLMRSELKSVHEYQADSHALNHGLDTYGYQLLLIKKAAGPKFPTLGNNLNHSRLKHRIAMMNRPGGISRAGKMLYLLPAGALLAGIFALTSPGIKAVIAPRKMVASVKGTATPDKPDRLDDFEVFIDGQELPLERLDDISPASIKAVTVEKNKNRKQIYIDTKND